MREIRPSGSEGGARFKPLSLPLSAASLHSIQGNRGGFSPGESSAGPETDFLREFDGRCEIHSHFFRRVRWTSDWILNRDV